MALGDQLERLVGLMARLRGPDGCPWDRKQTLRSLRPFILEEAYELVDAIDDSDMQAIREELGDLVLEVLFVSQICAENSALTISDVLASLEGKIIRRHPHVFGRRRARDPEEALARWEEMKDSEKAGKPSVLAEVARALPALTKAVKLSAQAARVGLDWKSADDVLDKLAEETAELERARARRDQAAIEEEVGDVLFAVANLARHLRVDPEMALHAANRKFAKRVRYVEQRLEAENRSPNESSPEELDALWEDAKKIG